MKRCKGKFCLVNSFLALSLCVGAAHAVRYGGSCTYSAGVMRVFKKSGQETKAENKTFLWVYNAAWGHGNEMHTSLGNADGFGLDDDHDIEYLMWGSHNPPTAANPEYSLVKESSTKATFIIDRGGNNITRIPVDDCSHWTCTSDADSRCDDPDNKWL
jgi:hypothetical protein